MKREPNLLPGARLSVLNSSGSDVWQTALNNRDSATSRVHLYGIMMKNNDCGFDFDEFYHFISSLKSGTEAVFRLLAAVEKLG